MIEILYKPSFIRQYKKLPLELQEEVKDKGASDKFQKHALIS